MDMLEDNVPPPPGNDDDDDDIAPPEEDDEYLDDFDVVSSLNNDETLSSRFGSVFTAAEDVERAPGPDAGGAGAFMRHRSRSNVNWSRNQSTFSSSDAAAAGSGGGSSTDPLGRSRKEDGVRIVEIDREVLYMQQALRYHMVTRPKGVPPLASERAHLMSLIQSYFIMHGFHRSATALRNAEDDDLSDAQTLLSESLPTHRLELPKLVQESARKAQGLFDDDQAWRSHNLFEHKVPLRVVDESSRAEGGPLSLLIERLILEETDIPFTEGKPDVNFTTIFLLMCPCFACPDVLFSQLTKLFKTVTAHAELFGEKRAVHLQRRVLQVLFSWATLSAVDMTRTLTERVAAFAISTVYSGAHHFEVVKVASQLLALIQKRRNILHEDSWQPFPRLTVAPPAGDAPQPALRADAVVKHFREIPEKEVVRQLCLMTFELYQSVRPREFINCAWMDPIMQDTCRDLQRFMSFFEDVSLWVASLIVTPVDLAERRSIYKRCVRIARTFYDVQNLFMTQAFLNGIEHTCVTRMADTVSCKAADQDISDDLDALRNAMNPFDSVQKKMPHKLNSAFLPDISPYLSDMCHASEHTKSTYPPQDPTGEVQVNWSKMLHMGKVIVRLVSFQSIPYKFQPLPIVQRLLWQMPGRRDVETLFKMSKERESGTR